MIFYRTEMLPNALAEHTKVGSPNFVGDDEIRAVEDEVR